jgi:hypothetical protein
MHYSYTRGRRKNMPFHLDPPKMFYSYTGVNTKNMLDRINALSSCCYLSKVCCRKEASGYAKVIHKKIELRKNGQVFEIFKQWVLRCPPEKKRDE